MLPRLVRDWKHAPTHRRVWALAAPMIASNVTVPLVTMVDTAVAGHLPHARQLAAVAVGGAVFTMLAWVFGFLRMGTTGFSAQANGRADGTGLRNVFWQSVGLALVLAVPALVLTWLLLPWILGFMHASADLRTLAFAYLHIRLVALPVVLVNYTVTGWLLGVENARAAFTMLVVTNVVNIALNLLLVPVFHLGVPGIAIASVGGALAGMLYGLARVHRELALRPGAPDWEALRHRASWRRLLAVNRDIFLRSLALQGVFFSVTLLGTRLGTDVVAANAVLMNGLMVVSYALDGLANAVEAMSGHAIGAHDGTALRRVLVVSGGWSALASLVFAAFFNWGGALFVDIQTSIANVREVAYASLPWLTVLPLVAVWSFFLDGLFVGATRGREMRDSMLGAAAGFALLAWWLLPAFGNQGLWAAFLGFMALRTAIMAAVTHVLSRRHAWVR